MPAHQRPRKTTNHRICSIAIVAMIAWLLPAVSALGAPTEIKLNASDAAPLDRFGRGVAIDGARLVIGSFHDDDGATDGGSAYVFERTGGGWDEVAKLTPDDPQAAKHFGEQVVIDGDTIVVGSTGAVYVYTPSGSGWSEKKLVASDGVAGDYFGASVDIDGDTIVVGAYGDDSFRGSAYVYTRGPGGWTEVDKITASDREEDDNFGGAVGIDGDTIVVGALFDHVMGVRRGSAYVYNRTGATWATRTEQPLAALGTLGGAEFGRSVAIDGDRIIIGANGDFNPITRDGTGTVFIYTRDITTGDFGNQVRIWASDGDGGDNFGFSVDLDGDMLLVGSFNDDVFADTGAGPVRQVDAGSAYLFDLEEGLLNETLKIVSSEAIAGDASDDWFGISVGIDGLNAVMGADLDDDDGDMSGSAYVFEDLLEPPPPPAVEGFIVPKKIRFTRPEDATARRPAGIELECALDGGPDLVNWALPATLELGTRIIPVIDLRPKSGGKKLVHKEDGVKVTIVPPKNGGSKATLKVEVEGDLTGDIPYEGLVRVRYRGVFFDVSAVALLGGGKFSISSVSGSLPEPEFALGKIRSVFKGKPTKPKGEFRVKGWFASDGVVPPVAPEVTVFFGGAYSARIASGDFVRTGSGWRFSGGGEGVTKLDLDYATGEFSVKAKKVYLGPRPPDGASAFRVGLELDDVGLGALVRAVRSGKELDY